MSKEKEIWKDIEGYEGRYQVSSLGKVRSRAKTNNGEWRMMKLHQNRYGYMTVALSYQNKCKHRTVHRLVASAFVPGYKAGLIVNHKDENKANNRWENLTWMTMPANNSYGSKVRRIKEKMGNPVLQISKEGEIIARYVSIAEAARAIKRDPSTITSVLRGRTQTAAGYFWSFDTEKKSFTPNPTERIIKEPELVANLEGEEWRLVDGYNKPYYISNLGRVKSVNTHNGNELLMRTFLHAAGYPMITLAKGNKSVKIGVHRLVAFAFIPGYMPGLVVNHKDENRGNPRADNLEWCTQKYNCNYGHHNERLAEAFNMPVIQMNMNGTPMAYYPSITAASIMVGGGAALAAIARCCRGELKTSYGYMWRYAKEGEQNCKPTSEFLFTRRDTSKKPIVQMNMKGQPVAEYPSQKIAARSLGFHSHSPIGNCCRGEAPSAYGYRWRYKEENEQLVFVNDNGNSNYNHVHRVKHAIVQLTLGGKVVAEYPSGFAAGKALGRSAGNINLCCRGLTPSAYGYKWKYKNENSE